MEGAGAGARMPVLAWPASACSWSSRSSPSPDPGRPRAFAGRRPRETIQDMSGDVDPLLEGRNETPLQRCDRNLVELLQEVRVVQTGVQVLFAFLLMAPLSARFPQLSAGQRMEYFVTLVAAGLAALVLTAPTA